eukprot:TRINITY_DN22849_c0_g1_i1.p1 TRINITY_DN22849_c0_g1~~TRINITY_DN22849_c0_g1_i1.p1  ORF type:complete len:183 (+),score=26.11 TRINITY_DN22849_c0_g1_i1:340-888(+)
MEIETKMTFAGVEKLSTAKASAVTRVVGGAVGTCNVSSRICVENRPQFTESGLLSSMAEASHKLIKFLSQHATTALTAPELAKHRVMYSLSKESRLAMEKKLMQEMADKMTEVVRDMAHNQQRPRRVQSVKLESRPNRPPERTHRQCRIRLNSVEWLAQHTRVTRQHDVPIDLLHATLQRAC